MELKEKEPTSYSFGTQFEPSDEPVKQPLDDNEGVMIVETALSAEKPVEEEGMCMHKEICLWICLSYCHIIDASIIHFFLLYKFQWLANSNALRLQ